MAIKNTQLCNINPGPLLYIPGTYETYSKVLHLMGILQFRSHRNPQIKISYSILNIQKLNSYKKYSTLSHQPGTTPVHTRDMETLF